MNYAVAAAGTGGHIYPALAVARELESRGKRVFWFGTPGGLEASYANNHIPLKATPVVGLTGKLMRILNLLKIMPQVVKHLRHNKIKKVIVFGGYISVPVGLAASLLGLELYIQEQNAIAGRANRLLFPFAKKVFVAYPRVFCGKKVLLTGNPLRFRNNWRVPKKVLVMGGSLGANSLYAKIVEFAKNLPEYQFRVISGMVNGAKAGDSENVEIVGFSDDISAMYNWADVVIARSGALTISEAGLFGLPMLLVPLASSADNHQYYNALYSNASMVSESVFTFAVLSEWLANGSSTALDKIMAVI